MYAWGDIIKQQGGQHFLKAKLHSRYLKSDRQEISNYTAGTW